MELVTAHLPLALEACDAKSLAAVLAKRGNQPLAVDDARELLGSLDELRAAYEGGDAPDQRGLEFQSRGVGGVILWSPTLSARQALIRLDRWNVPAEWAEYAAEWINSCVGWILANCRDAQAMELWNEHSAQKLVEDWLPSVTCTSAELSAAVAELIAPALYPPIREGDPSRKKALAGRTSRDSWPASLKPSPGALRATGCTRFPKRTSIGYSGPPPTGRARSKPRSTPRNSAPTIPASTPANAGSASTPN